MDTSTNSSARNAGRHLYGSRSMCMPAVTKERFIHTAHGRASTTEMKERNKRKGNIMKHIKVKYLRNIERIKSISIGDWIDLRAADDTIMKAGEYTMIPLGIAMELPKGYEALVAPRSSTFGKYGLMLANSIGIIDESYKGDNDEWHFLAYAVRDTIIRKNDRICQFRIIKHQPKVKMIEVESLGNADRGGIGSTGRR